MEPLVFLKSAELPGASDPYQRALNDFARAGGHAGAAGLRVPNAALIAPEAAPKKRARIWELTAMLHCSIIGTCLMAGELRSLLRRCGMPLDSCATDHELHE